MEDDIFVCIIVVALFYFIGGVFKLISLICGV